MKLPRMSLSHPQLGLLHGSTALKGVTEYRGIKYASLSGKFAAATLCTPGASSAALNLKDYG